MLSKVSDLPGKAQSLGHFVPGRRRRNTGNLAMSAGYAGNTAVEIPFAMTALCWHSQEV